MSFKATAINAEDVQPGQAFSTAGPDYWIDERDPAAIGERVYLRTLAPCPRDEIGRLVWIITWEVE